MAETGILSQLPLELRRKIYRYLVSGAHILPTQSWKNIHSKYHGKHPEDKEWKDPFGTSGIENDEWPFHLDNRILRASHQIHAEVSALLFQESTFWVTYHIADLNRGLQDLDIGALETNLHRIRDLTICIEEEDDAPEYKADDLPHLPKNEDTAGKGKKKKKTARGIAQLLERYAARCTALHRLTVRFGFEEARPRPRDPQSKWRPLLEHILHDSAMQRALASFAVRDEVAIKTDIKFEPFYTEEISEYVSGVAKWKGWESKSEKSAFWYELNTDEDGPIEKWVLRPKKKDGEVREEKSKRTIDEEVVKEFVKKQKNLHATAAE